MNLKPENFKPLNDRVLVRVEEFKDGSRDSVIIKPETSQVAPQTGVVIAVGDGRIFDSGVVKPLTVKPGDKVVFGLYCGMDVTILDGHKIMREDEISAIISD
jgi:chaperonin GroES